MKRKSDDAYIVKILVLLIIMESKSLKSFSFSGQYQGPPPPQQMMHPNQPPQMNMMASPPPMPQQQQQQQFAGGPLAAPPQHPSHPPSMPPLGPTHIQGPPMGNSLPPQQNMMVSYHFKTFNYPTNILELY